MKKHKVALFSLLVLLISGIGWAQSQQTKPASKPTEEPKDVTVVEEKTDKDGYIYRTIKYKEGNIVVTQTLVIPPFPGLKDRKPINVDTMNMDSVMVLVDKTNYLIAVLYKRKRIRQYRAVFGPDRLKDKMYEGDRSTPEGWFKIVQTKDHSTWQKFLLLDYPNQESYTKFSERKRKNEIPPNASIGGAVGIHGTFKGGDQLVDMGVGWTDGCIALKSTDITDFCKFVRNGTRVYVRR
jgi:lipoprotein-anchoring transpeptidase ErfK/SrfK